MAPPQEFDTARGCPEMIASGHSEAASVITSVQFAGRAFFIQSFILSAASRRLCACGSSASPAAVRRKSRLERSNSLTPSSSSSAETERQIVEWLVYRLLAAAEKLPASAAAMKCPSCSSSISVIEGVGQQLRELIAHIAVAGLGAEHLHLR